MTIYAGSKSLVSIYSVKTEKDNGMKLDLFTYILPFIGFIVDAAIKRAFYISAKLIFVIFKVLVILFYLAVYVLALQKNNEIRYYYIVIANQIVFPLFMALYWYLLIKGKLKWIKNLNNNL